MPRQIALRKRRSLERHFPGGAPARMPKPLSRLSPVFLGLMKALIQRVSRAAVSADGREAGRIGPGFVVFLGVRREDAESDAKYLAEKTAGLRVFSDDKGLMNLSLWDTGGEVLVISQFTLHADTRKGNRPSFIEAAPADVARRLYEEYVRHLRALLGEARVRTGVFQAMMQVEILNNGPVTIELKSKNEQDHSPGPR